MTKGKTCAGDVIFARMLDTFPERLMGEFVEIMAGVLLKGSGFGIENCMLIALLSFEKSMAGMES